MAMAVAIPNCIGIVASVQAAVISCSPQNKNTVHGRANNRNDRPKGETSGWLNGVIVIIRKHAYRASCHGSLPTTS